MTTADATGSFALGVMTVPADYKLVVRASGFLTHVETVTVGDDRRVPLDISLMPGTDVGGERSIAFTEPQDGATVNTDSVTLYGVARGFEIQSVTVNGKAGESLGANGFSATVPLVEGLNELVAEVIGVDGEKVRGTLRISRRLTTGRVPDDMKAKGGCSSAGGLELFALVALVGGVLRRRRRFAS